MIYHLAKASPIKLIEGNTIEYGWYHFFDSLLSALKYSIIILDISILSSQYLSKRCHSESIECLFYVINPFYYVENALIHVAECCNVFAVMPKPRWLGSVMVGCYKNTSENRSGLWLLWLPFDIRKFYILLNRIRFKLQPFWKNNWGFQPHEWICYRLEWWEAIWHNKFNICAF